MGDFADDNLTKITPTILAHEGGTKFWEIIAYANERANEFLFVRRWGPIDKRVIGGEILASRFVAERTCYADYNSLIKAKLREGYAVHSSDRQALRDVWRQSALGRDTFENDFYIEPDKLGDVLMTHYGPANYAKLMGRTSMSEWFSSALADVIVEGLSEPVVRDEHWGTW